MRRRARCFCAAIMAQKTRVVISHHHSGIIWCPVLLSSGFLAVIGFVCVVCCIFEITSVSIVFEIAENIAVIKLFIVKIVEIIGDGKLLAATLAAENESKVSQSASNAQTGKNLRKCLFLTGKNCGKQ